MSDFFEFLVVITVFLSVLFVIGFLVIRSEKESKLNARERFLECVERTEDTIWCYDQVAK